MSRILLVDHHDSFTFNVWQLVESLGSDTLIHTRVGANVPLVSRQSDRTTLKLGDAVGIEIDPNALLFFDQQGRAIREMKQAA